MLKTERKVTTTFPYSEIYFLCRIFYLTILKHSEWSMKAHISININILTQNHEFINNPMLIICKANCTFLFCHKGERR